MNLFWAFTVVKMEWRGVSWSLQLCASLEAPICSLNTKYNCLRKKWWYNKPKDSPDLKDSSPFWDFLDDNIKHFKTMKNRYRIQFSSLKVLQRLGLNKIGLLLCPSLIILSYGWDWGCLEDQLRLRLRLKMILGWGWRLKWGWCWVEVQVLFSWKWVEFRLSWVEVEFRVRMGFHRVRAMVQKKFRSTHVAGQNFFICFLQFLLSIMT